MTPKKRSLFYQSLTGNTYQTVADPGFDLGGVLCQRGGGLDNH